MRRTEQFRKPSLMFRLFGETKLFAWVIYGAALVQCAFVAGLVWVVVHFIAKWW